MRAHRVLAPAALAALLGACAGPTPPEALRSPCESPKRYALGSVDPRTLLSAEELRAELAEAAAIWNAAQRKPLLVEDPAAPLRVDFSYDERQPLDEMTARLQDNLKRSEGDFDAEQKAYSAYVEDFNRRQAALRAEIEAYNKNGGGAEEARGLDARRTALERERAEVEAKGARVRADLASLQAQGRLYNQSASEFNQALSAKPEQGLWDGKTDRITVWFAATKQERVHTMAHEFGHALGMAHVVDPGAIMYPRTNASLALSDADREALRKEVCSRRVPARN